MDIKTLNNKQNDYLIKLCDFLKGYTNTVYSSDVINGILEKQSYDEDDRQFILRAIDWYLEQRKFKKH